MAQFTSSCRSQLRKLTVIVVVDPKFGLVLEEQYGRVKGLHSMISTNFSTRDNKCQDNAPITKF